MRTGYCDLDGSRCITMSQSVAYQVGEHLGDTVKRQTRFLPRASSSSRRSS